MIVFLLNDTIRTENTRAAFKINILFSVSLQDTPFSMNVRDIFRKLATNKFIPDFDYKYYKLSFQTVFFTSHYKYCCCPCAFDHEWLAYISDKGEINEELYKKVEANLLAGKCLHVDHVSSDYVRETAVYGIHLAAAVGTEKAVKQDLGVTHREIQTTIFHLSPYTLAVLKKNIKTTTLRYKNLAKHFESQTYSLYRMLHLVYPERSGTNENVIQLRDESLLEFCVRNGNKELLQVVLLPNTASYRTQFAKALGLAIRSNALDIANELITFLKKMTSRTDVFCAGIECIILIFLDKPDILEKVLKACRQADLHVDENLKCSLVHLCAARGQDQCYNILSEYQLLPRDLSQYKILAHLQILLNVFDDLPDLVKDELEKIPDLGTVLNAVSESIPMGLCRYQQKVSILHMLFSDKSSNSNLLKKCNPVKTSCRPVIKWILHQDGIVDKVNKNNQTPLTFLLMYEGHEYALDFRPNLEMLLYMNSNLELNPSAVWYCLRVDENLFSKWMSDNLKFPQIFLTDAKEHSVFGHNDGSDYALEFTAPLLLECGYTAERKTLVDALDRNLHPDVLMYIRAYIDTPRSLKLRCRDVLKKHFKGSLLHQFVEKSQIPRHVKEFILIKTILKCA